MIALMFAALVVPPVEPVKCEQRQVQFTEADRRAAPKKLGELPPAQLYLTVDRSIDKCPAPVIVRYNIGGRQR
ncbi:hypothetical protein [Glacieibacterium sp.]|uniref:hypothetical protein n=1 Tax=Glacieibacterium sp. TaxID=2860237 RepID=UPI003AFF8B21